MALTGIEPPPTGTPVIQKNGIMQKNWLDWLLLALIGRVESIGFVRKSVALTAQHAAIGATALLANAGAGVYRISRYVQVSVIDGAASAVQLTFTYTYLGQVLTLVGANVNGDTLTSRDEGQDTIRVDGNSTIFYATTYASTTPNKMNYTIDAVLEALAN